MTAAIDNSNGRKWARFTLSLALLASVGGNVWHTVLVDSTIPVAARVFPAVIWPLFTFLGIEVLVRIIWERSFTHRLARNMVLFPALPAAIVSYEHLHGLLIALAERPVIAIIGPLAIDGAMIGMTMALLFTRTLPVEPEVAPEQIPVLTPVTETGGGKSELTGDKLGKILEADPEFVAAREAFHANEARISREEASAARAGYPETKRERAVRATPDDMRKAVLALMDGKTVAEACVIAGFDPASKRGAVGRYKTVINRLRNDPQADVSGVAGIHPALLDEIRAWANLERVR